MHDTSPEMQELYRKKLLELSPEARLLMASGMFDAARELVLASLPDGLSETEIKRHLLRRFYGEEYAGVIPLKESKDKIQ